MKSLIEKNINWSGVGKHPKSEYVFSIGKAVVSKDAAVLSVELKLNFIIPYADLAKIRECILLEIGQLSDVKFRCSYEDLILSEPEIVRRYLPYLIAETEGVSGALMRTILVEEVRLEAGVLHLYALGDEAVCRLNEEVAPIFQRKLRDSFGLSLSVRFENHHFACGETRKSREEQRRLAEQEAGRPAGKSARSAAGKKADGAGDVKGRLVFGRTIPPAAKITPLAALNEESGNVTVEGVIFSKSERDVYDQEQKKLVTLMITDQENSIGIKLYPDRKTFAKIDEQLSPGARIRVRGKAALDRFDYELTIAGRDIEKLPVSHRQDNAEKKRVELHAHTKMSALDGLADASELVKLAAEWGHPAVAITDHGVVQAFPEAAKAAKKSGIKVILGLEGYLFDDFQAASEAGGADQAAAQAAGGETSGAASNIRAFRPAKTKKKAAAEKDAVTAETEETAVVTWSKDAGYYYPEPIPYKSGPTNHIILLAKNQTGLRNLYKLVSYSHLHYFYRKPRIPKSVLTRFREGLIIGSACEAGEVYQAVLKNRPEEDLFRIASFYDYLEIQPLINNQFLIDSQVVPDVEALRRHNEKIVELGRQLQKPVVATCDVHYLDRPHAAFRKVLMAGQGYKDIEGDKGLYFRTTEEMLDEFRWLGEETAREVVIRAPNLIAEQIENLYPVPSGKFPPKIENADVILRSTCMETAWSIYGNPLPPEIQSRLARELDSIINNGYAVMYVSAQKLVQKSMDDGYLVGSRGSVGSSFAATMAGITEVNPLPPHYICPNPDCRHFEWGDVAIYDCGVDMPAAFCSNCGAQYRQDGFNIPFETFLGFEGDKEPDIDLNFAGEYQAHAHRYVEELFGKENVFRAGTISTVASRTAYGYVMKYHEERGLPVNKWEVERLTVGCTGVRRTTGQHPGGIIIIPAGNDIFEFCPVQYPANDEKTGIITTHFDYHSIDENLLKLDILGHDVPSMIRHLQDMTGVDPLLVPLNDEKVNSLFLGTEGLDIKEKNYPFTHGSYGIPEFGTRFVRQMLDDTQPSKFADLIRISGFSHGTNVWINNAQEFIKNGRATMKDAISTRDDIMNYLISKGMSNKESFKIMEKVRRGKGVTEGEAEAMRHCHVPDWYIESCRRIEYMFPRAHAVAYVMMSYRIAWYKVYHPAAFYAVYFTTRVADFNPAAALEGSAAVRRRIQSIELKGKNATRKEQEEQIVLEVAYEMLARGYEFLPADVDHSDSCRFTVEDGKIRVPLAALPGVGENAARAIRKAFEEAPFISVDDLRRRARANKTAIEALVQAGALQDLPETNQISLF